MNRANMAGNNMRFYDSAQLGVTNELLGDARDRMSRQEQIRMQDAANRQAYKTYKAQSGQRGFNNLMNIARTGARIYAAAATGGATEGLIAATDLATTAAQSQQQGNIPMEGRSNWSGTSNVNSGTQLNYNNNMRPSMIGRNMWSSSEPLPSTSMSHGSPWRMQGRSRNMMLPYGTGSGTIY